MIKITVDESQAFDMLVGLNVKISNSPKDKFKQFTENFKSLALEIREQIGELLYYKIISSEEYNNLYRANFDTFCLVELGMDSEPETLARKTADMNLKRFQCKKKLQNVFFNNDLKEIKI
jgi:hypothetical protein